VRQRVSFRRRDPNRDGVDGLIGADGDQRTRHPSTMIDAAT
jgi:hypothetical protein